MPRHVTLTAEKHSGDYLKSVETPPDDKNLNDHVFNSNLGRELSERYTQIQDRYENDTHYSRNRLETELRYRSANKSLTEWTLGRMIDDNVRRPVRRFVVRSFKDEIRKSRENRQPVRRHKQGTGKPGSAANTDQTNEGVLHSEEQDSGISLHEIYMTVENFYNNGLILNDETIMRFRYDIPAGVMDLAFKGWFVDTSLDYYVMPLNFTSTNGFGDNTPNAERLSFSMSKNLQSLGLSTAVRYGLAKQAINAGMNKHVVGPLSAGVDQSVYTTGAAKNETTYRLNVGLSF